MTNQLIQCFDNIGLKFMEQSKPEIAKESTTPAAENNRKELSSIPKTEKEKIEIYSYTERRSKGTEAGRNVL